MGDEKRIAIKVNADNDSLLPLSNGVFVIGNVDELNGAGAEEMAFMPTRHELLQLVKYWTREILEIRYSWFLSAGTDSTEIRV